MTPLLRTSLVAALCSSGAAALLGVLVGCRSSTNVPPTTNVTITSAELESLSNDDAIMRVATSRCERELACNKIGQGRAFDDQPTCLERMGALMDEEVGKSLCPRGVDAFAVSACLLGIQRTECGGELEHSTNLPACTKTSLCVH